MGEGSGHRTENDVASSKSEGLFWWCDLRTLGGRVETGMDSKLSCRGHRRAHRTLPTRRARPLFLSLGGKYPCPGNFKILSPEIRFMSVSGE